MVTKEKLKACANDLMFKMSDEQYDILEDEFKVTLKQIDVFNQIEGLEEVSPMTYPFDLELDDSILRDDVYNNEICFDDMRVNVKEYENDMVKVPKVVE